MRFVRLAAAVLSAAVAGSVAAEEPKGKVGLEYLNSLAFKQGHHDQSYLVTFYIGAK